jgi:hypothetical protein
MQTPSRLTFAVALIGLAALTFIYGDFTLQWQPVPAWVPDRRFLAYLSGSILLAERWRSCDARQCARVARFLRLFVALGSPAEGAQRSAPRAHRGHLSGLGDRVVLVARGRCSRR